MGEKMTIEEMRMRMRKKGFEFSRDEIVKLDEKVDVKLPKMNIKLREQPQTGFCFGISSNPKSIKSK